MQITQINLQPYFGGGEVYTAFLTRALARLGVSTRLLVHPDAHYWPNMKLPSGTQLVVVDYANAIQEYFQKPKEWVIGHGPLTPEVIEVIHRRGGLATAISHMPVQGRKPERFREHDQVFAVSGWVLQGLVETGLPAWPTPLYGVADLRGSGTKNPIWRGEIYDWDRRKVRDRMLARINPLITYFRKPECYFKKPGLTLGIVSRITPIKQFPLLFSKISSAISRFPQVNIEIFGSGGYASMRDLRQALLPISKQTRFWGHQTDVFSVYGGIDYLMTGLPEKEALGLNVLEAQASGTPVLAPNAPPFTETILQGKTGYFYQDPRSDAGKDFERLLSQLLSQELVLDPTQAKDHLEGFTLDALAERLRPVVAWAERNLR